MSLPNSLSLILLLTCSLVASNTWAAAELAGKITMLVGQAAATTTTGETRALKKGGNIYVGDTIETGMKCYVKIKYTDGTTILLRPDTGLVINAYSDTPEGGESVATLLKGGLRSVTGAISAEKKGNYKVKTPVATLGIRGTDFVMRLCQEKEDEKGQKKNDCEGTSDDGLYTSTNDGGTSLENGAGSLNSEAGEHAYVEGFDVPPVKLAKAPGVLINENLPNPMGDDTFFIEGPGCAGP